MAASLFAAVNLPGIVQSAFGVVGGDKETAEAAEMWRFGPKAWKPYFNIRDPKTIQDRAETEVLWRR
jgi:hypothetical protein